MSRQLSIAIRGSGGSDAGVALPTLVRTLGALQKAVLQIGEMLNVQRLPSGDAGPTRGPFSKAVLSACEFRVRELRTGSAEALLELPSPEPRLLDADDLGLRALQTIRELTRELAGAATWERVRELLPQDGYRSLVLASFRDLCPTAQERTVVAVWDPEHAGDVSRIEPAARTRVQLLAARSDASDVIEERQFIGHVNMLQGRPPGAALLLHGGRSLPLPTDDELVGELLALWRQRVIVRAICRVVPQPDGDDHIAEVKAISEVAAVDDGPLVIESVTLPDGEVPLREPLEVLASFTDNLVSFEYAPLGVLAYAETREEAEQAFRDELAWVWARYANASDEGLAAGGLRLRDQLRDMVLEGAR